MKSYTVKLAGKEYEILQDTDGKFIKPDFVKKLESYGTDVKPAHEPICVARKPLDGTVSQNVLKHGTGGLNIDGTRIPLNGDKPREANTDKGADSMFMGSKSFKTGTMPATGRFPANLIHDGSDEVEAVFPQTKSGARKAGFTNKLTGYKASSYEMRVEWDKDIPADYGSASRYFYCAKASKSERNAGLEGFEVRQTATYDSKANNYLADVNHADGKYQAAKAPAQNHHPTVKPLSLTKYLATLIKPPTGGRLLVPFSGSGSEMIGALQAGWEYVEGVELTEEYIPIAEARIKYWLAQKEEDTKQLELV